MPDVLYRQSQFDFKLARIKKFQEFSFQIEKMYRENH